MKQAKLAGLSVLVTRPEAQAEGLACAIERAAGKAVRWPLLEIEHFYPDGEADCRARIDQQLRHIDRFDYVIFVSSNAARPVIAWLRDHSCGWPPNTVCYAIGTATARTLRDGGIPVHSAAGAMNSETLLSLRPLIHVEGLRILLCRGEGGRTLLADTLRARGACLEHCLLYRRKLPSRQRGALARVLSEHGINAVQIGSGEALDNFLALLNGGGTGRIGADLVLVLPSERVADMARERGFARCLVTEKPTDAGIMDALQRLAQERTS